MLITFPQRTRTPAAARPVPADVISYASFRKARKEAASARRLHHRFDAFLQELQELEREWESLGLSSANAPLEMDTARHLAARYCPYMGPTEIKLRQDDLIRTVMALGSIDDINRVVDSVSPWTLMDIIDQSPRGFFSPRAIAFWRRRLGLDATFGSHAERQPTG